MSQNLLIEIGTEELPPKALSKLSASFTDSIINAINTDLLSFDAHIAYATPRRLALVIENLDSKQADRQEEKLGPNVKAAYDSDGNPTKAATGFAKSCGVEFSEISTSQTDKGERLSYAQTITGSDTVELIEGYVHSALAALPVPKRMRWGANRAEFVRPIKWANLSFGDTLINANIMGVATTNTTRGHRFHSPEEATVNASNYEATLREKSVIADFSERQAMIREQVEAEAEKLGGIAQISDSLLDEVTSLVEYPVALTGKFEAAFLEVPAQALISSMVEHQKYFHILDKHGELLPNFITVSNIRSKDPTQVINGNERVIRPRLADARFFFETDKKVSLESRLERLKAIVFQKDLGTVFDKSQRISQLATIIAKKIGANQAHAARAALLAKTDLVSEMVLEFTDLQGLMGKYYALNDGEDAGVALAIEEQYLPKGAGGQLPSSDIGAVVALADRIDTLIGIFGIGQKPTGNKDPFALRRQALGILNIIIDKGLNLDLEDIFSEAKALFTVELADNTVADSLAYTLERFRAHYQSQGLITEIYLSVAARDITQPQDFDLRVQAVADFNEKPEAESLAAANKRVANILAKVEGKVSSNINTALLTEAAEKALVETIQSSSIQTALTSTDYNVSLNALATLKDPIDTFFEEVMVMADDEAIKNNRLAILQNLRDAFLNVADISLLAK